ncbi:ABC transporter permease subunit [Burkholderiaceae bacterium DAT-1]|nr:ABC transporter permease subunit [Burkholderiaceae bacterium DAT-1]
MFKRYGPSSPMDGLPNRWDWALLPMILALLVAVGYVAMQMSRPFSIGQELPISLDPLYLPYYLLRTIMRMFIALFFSLLFAVAFASIAARSKTAEKIMIPAIDILQSIPVLGFQAIAVAPFIALFPGNLLGAECAAIFAIFTAQAWNMALSLYQSFKTVPPELNEASRIFRLSPWQRFWRLDLPFGTPGLLWNMMMSMSGGWFMLVFSEAILVAGQDIRLPGIGSYVKTAIDARDLGAIGWAISAMLIGILLYDQLFFRPLLAWADKFKFEESQGEQAQQSWLLDWMRRSKITLALTEKFWNKMSGALGWFKLHYDGTSIRSRQRPIDPRWERATDALFTALALIACWKMFVFVHSEIGWAEVGHVFKLGLLTLTRVMVMIALASIVWVPISVWLGLRPVYSQKIQAIAQFLAAFPVNLMFPLVVFVLVTFKINPNIGLTPLMVFGTQWYILFNVVAGASTIPNELRLAADNLGLKGWLKWKRVYLPAVFPSFVTGAITASGGSWNASIAVEYVTWGDVKLKADGLGSYIAMMTESGDFHRNALGMIVMCIFVLCLNRFFWRKLYLLAEDRSR